MILAIVTITLVLFGFQPVPIDVTAIAVVAFPNEPIIPLALVIGPLLELPLLGIIAQAHIEIRNRGLWHGGDNLE